ncbi:MAG: hypothetical protein ACRD5M_07165 [Candidatus Acidiferrales bacterium]
MDERAPAGIVAVKNAKADMKQENPLSDHYVAAHLPGQPQAVAIPLEVALRKPAERRKVALVVAHGMGSQVPYETLEGIVQEIRKHGFGTGQQEIPVRVGLADLNGTLLARAEMTLRDSDQREIDLHVYEAYWAPLTEGKVTARDAIWFLFMGGLRGFRGSGKKGQFKRWMFQNWQAFQIHHFRLLAAFLLAMGVIASLFVMNAAIATLTAKSFAAPSNLLPVVTRDFWAFEWRAIVYLLLGIGIPMWLRGWRQKNRKTLELWGPVKYFLRFSVFLAIAMTIRSGASVGWHLLRQGGGSPLNFVSGLRADLNQATSYVAGTLPASVGDLIGKVWEILSAITVFLLGGPTSPSNPTLNQMQPNIRQLVVLGIGVAIAYAGRWFLREYVGDVAVYVSSFAVSKFDELRNQIQAATLNVFQHVYQLESEKSKARRAEQVTRGERISEIEFEYREVVVAGHSLGSLIAYDTLNALINLPPESLLDGQSLDVPGRTKAFITFGSPMDKTAFVFRTQRPEENEVREALAGTKQPMVLDYKFRPKHWVNLYAPDDWISGSLEYYDLPDPAQPVGPDNDKRVQNLVDPEGCVPLASHVFYWQSRILQEVLRNAIVLDPRAQTS